jgi:hypothetical protein
MIVLGSTKAPSMVLGLSQDSLSACFREMRGKLSMGWIATLGPSDFPRQTGGRFKIKVFPYSVPREIRDGFHGLSDFVMPKK